MVKKTSFSPASPEESGTLFALAARIKELAPWEWMDESEVFGLQNPETGELGFVSVMGMAGQHFAIAVYMGAEGLYGILDFASQETITNPEQLLDIPQLQASFEDRDTLDKQDRELIKRLGLKFRGAGAWPMFRSYRPGFMPWFVTAEETRFLAHALEQTLEVAPRVKNEPGILQPENDNGHGEIYLVRVPRRVDDGLVWEDKLMRVPPPEGESVRATLDADVLTLLRQLPQRQIEIEVDLFSLPAGMAERGERPYRPYMLMMAEPSSGMIVGVELLKPDPSLAEMHGQIPSKLAEWLSKAGVVPGRITARSGLVLDLIEPLAETLNIELYQADELPGIDAAANSMFGMMGDLF
ncbi:MAG TPA: hypothetical protein VLJ61_09845 [Pyrinomonadaceae bacterium]|nr:hypothetical protein [Pyrinomonadaceae bacterium]